ncbi:MAG: COG3014 family protein [Chitinophagaceae bacterium]
MHIKNYKVYGILYFVIFFISCGITYRDRTADIYRAIEKKHFNHAMVLISKNSLLNAKRNKLLFDMEKGSINFFLHKYDSSNLFWNNADELASIYGKTMESTLKGYTINPMQETYKGEDFEKMLLHYYKAQNYVTLGLNNDALIEARRITLTENQIKYKTNSKDNKYYTDVFSLFFQGLLYESSNMINDAFISYRNAMEAITKRPNHTWYGTKLSPYMLKSFYNAANYMGFQNDIQWWNKQLNISEEKSQQLIEPFPENELFLFVENGFVPYKGEQKIFLNLTGIDGTNAITFATDNGALSIPFFIPKGYQTSDFLTFQSIYIALPKYIVLPLHYTQIRLIDSTNQTIPLSMAMDLNVLTVETLKERRATDIVQTLTRVLLKKVIQIAATKSIQFSQYGNAASIASLVNVGLDLVAIASEKADTRNWQSLPAQIYFARIPLQEGKNTFTLKLHNLHSKIEKIISFNIQSNNEGKIFKHIRVW